MDAQGRFVATLLDASAKVFAAGAVTTFSSEGGESAVGEWGFSRLVGDVQARLQALSESVAAGRPELFRLDLEWLADAFAAREVSPAALAGALEHLPAELREGLPGEAADLACAHLEQGLAVLTAPARCAPDSDGAADEWADLADRFLLALLEGRRTDAEDLVVGAFRNGASVTDLHQQVIVRAQAEMGRMWVAGEIHVAEEHLGSRIVIGVLVLLRHHAVRERPTGPRVLVSSVQGNLHDIGGQLVSDQLELAGFETLFLGANTPVSDIVTAIEHFDVKLLAVSAGLGLHVRTTAQLIGAVRKAFPDLPILVGGGPFNQVDDLWRVVEATAWAPTADAGVAEARRLLGA